MSQTIGNQPSQQPPQPEPAFNEEALSYRALGIAGEAEEDQGWIEFRDQCRRQMNRPMHQRIKYGFFRMYKPVLDDAPWRSFASIREYRAWCAENLPDYLGFKPAKQ